MIYQQYVITDAGGHTAAIEISIPQSLLRQISGRQPGWEQTEQSATWRALTFGAFGAESGELVVFVREGDGESPRYFHLQFNARSKSGRNRPVLLLKRWRTMQGMRRLGSGTLFHGVNLLMQSGEMDWLRI